MPRAKILVVDDDRDLVELMVLVLRRAAWQPLFAHDGPTALQVFERERPQLVVLDVVIGASSGLDVLKALRQRSNVPVILLSRRGEVDDRVLGLETGANDYLPKPFNYRELVARIAVQLRRRGPDDVPVEEESRLQVGSLTLHFLDHSLTRDGQLVELTATEFRLLHYLMRHAGTVVPARTLLQEVWGYDQSGPDDLVRVTIHRLRRKIEDDPRRPRLLRTIPGVGLVLRAEVPTQ
jgi:DNA-binding response OmpR family regulator